MKSPEAGLPICPYWRRFTVVDGKHILALCGVGSIKEPLLPDNDGGSRLSFCPWSWGVNVAYHYPSIRRFIKLNGSWQKYHLGGFVNTTLEGEDGIRELEARWPQAVEDFRRAVANLAS